ncbi:MAG: LytR C-terminal domain-containing protein [Aeriscardovia sp.]|nr:LytR C-terminal domain-containing protein [Aeriscardovia sp.]MBR3359489.1 LytR C-terminal domain-containing protein [Aeriscardovia sp.]
MSKKQTEPTSFTDEFENASNGPVGLHRGKKSALARLYPYLAAAIVTVLLALCVWGIWSGEMKTLFSSHTNSSHSNSTSTSASSTTSSSTNSASSSSSTSTTAGTTASGQSSNTTSAAKSSSASTASINYSAQIIVYNDNGISGFAGNKASILKSAGYTNVSAENYPDQPRPETNAIWYTGASNAATAKAIASQLGISTVIQQSTSLAATIEVIYVSQ